MRYNMDSLREKYPNMWVSMKDCEFEKSGNIKSGELMGVYSDDEVEDAEYTNLKENTGYKFERTTDDLNVGYIHCTDHVIGSEE